MSVEAKNQGRAAPSGRRGATGGAYDKLWNRPGYLVRRLHQIHVALFLEECVGTSITPVQFGVLSILRDGQPLDQRQLGAEVGIDRTNIADVLARLESRGMIARVVNSEDRRRKLVSITAEGRAFVERQQCSMERAQERLVAPLSTTERRRLLDYLHRMVEANNETGRAELRRAER